MPSYTRRLEVDFDGNPAPQYWYDEGDRFEINKGIAGGASFHMLGTIYEDGWESSVTESKTLQKPCIGLYIKNDGDGEIKVTVGSKTLPTMKAQESIGMLFEPFGAVTVEVLSTTSYRVMVAR